MLEDFTCHSHDSGNPAGEHLRAYQLLSRRLPRRLDPVSVPRASALGHGMTPIKGAVYA